MWITSILATGFAAMTITGSPVVQSAGVAGLFVMGCFTLASIMRNRPKPGFTSEPRLNTGEVAVSLSAPSRKPSHIRLRKENTGETVLIVDGVEKYRGHDEDKAWRLLDLHQRRDA